MEVGQLPRSASVVAPPNGVSTPTLRQPVVSELPPVQVVTDTPDTPDVGADQFDAAQQRARNLSQVRSDLARQVSIDQESRLVILSEIERGSGAVVRQFPDEWQVKQRIYARAELERQLAVQSRADKEGEFAETVSQEA